ncbi:MAG: WYL domain-containing protein [Gammaproteobacteria bacterium RIFOXYA12_FULL_61_12]|nr:MAG: WYL domain-containing protein [Gammaproteobacteria bacterium RIFOXYD12_FULL_61_37]OGT93652.1 MAG: WYL domain-containing protein [Gammaproteobacteria bacterium RIFOXYA12_FULL_61_12]
MNDRTLRDLNQGQRERLAFIEFRLWFLGEVRRPDLMDRFGIAPAVATRDLAAYREMAPDNIGFDGRRKVYIPAEGFQPVFPHETERVLSALSRGFGEGLGRASAGFLPCDFPLRLNQPPLPVLAVITRAIHQRCAVRLIYHSLNTGPSARVILPLALVDSGLRWHARVFDRTSSEFRDLVITRMEAPQLLEREGIAPHEQLDRDIQWTRILTLELRPHPDQQRPEIVARDFGMTGERLVLNVRAAIAGYVLQQWNVDCSPDHSLDPRRYRLWLKDPLVLYGVENAALAPGYRAPGDNP